jgi:hypothetical protein
VVERFPDERTDAETVYSMADAALGAFSVFFMQSPSFLDFQCSVTEHRNGTKTYSHSVVTSVIVAPDNLRVIPLEPEFVTPPG